MAIIKYHTELKVYQKSFDVAMEIFKISFKFPIEEKYSLTDQIRRSSRSVSANISESWGKRRYPKSFVSNIIERSGGTREAWLMEEVFAPNCLTNIGSGNTANTRVGNLIQPRFITIRGVLEASKTTKHLW